MFYRMRGLSHQLILISILVLICIALAIIISQLEERARFFRRMARAQGRWIELPVPVGDLIASGDKITVFGHVFALPSFKNGDYRTPLYSRQKGKLLFEKYTIDQLTNTADPVLSVHGFSGRKVWLYWPRKYRNRMMILLHGWGSLHHAKVWQRGILEKLAETHGVALLAPEMGRANYLSRWYGETHDSMKYKMPIPGTLWVGAALPVWISANFFNPELFIAGYSTGSRGALMAAAFFPGNFKGLGYVSGDWDLIEDKGNLYVMAFGPLNKKNRVRWIVDNAAYLAHRYRGLRVYGAHSTRDEVTPAFQTELMKQALTNLRVENSIEIDGKIPGGHNWRYWNRVFPLMFKYLF